MKILIGVLLAAAVLLLLPLSARLRWNGTLAVWAGIGPLRVKVYDGAARGKSRRRPPEKRPGTGGRPRRRSRGKSWTLRCSGTLPPRCRRRCAGSAGGCASPGWRCGRCSPAATPAEAAVRAGRAGAVFYSLYGVLCQVFTVGEPQVLILPDFSIDIRDNYYIEGIVTLCPAALLAFGAGFVRRFAARQLRRRDTADREEDYGQQSKRPDGGQL